MEQLLLHLFGDYILQTNYMAEWKVRKSRVAFWHAFTYTIPFLLITKNILALSIICGTHFLIDRYSLAKYLLIWKGSPPNAEYTYEDGYVYPVYRDFMFVVYVVTDNTFHLIINYFALRV